MPDADLTTPPPSLADLGDRLAGDLTTLDAELAEIELLVTQARAEAARHEGRRAATVTKLTALGPDGDLQERLDLTTNLVTLSKRSALMDSQVDVLEGKRRALQRYRDAIAVYGETADAVAASSGPSGGGSPFDGLDPDAPMPAAVSRLLLTAQEDLRREIARAMHDGPAQSLTNIVLQAQIVERLVLKDPQMAAGEVRQLIAMVQATLDATKTFIFDVRPMVLDDLGLVPTLRRAARDRGRRAGIPVDFNSMGHGSAPADGPGERAVPDARRGPRRLPDGGAGARVAAAGLGRPPGGRPHRDPDGRQLATHRIPRTTRRGPPALAAMLEDRRADEREAVQAAERDAIVVLPATTWREIQSRAASVGVQAELLGEGGEVRLIAEPSAAGVIDAGRRVIHRAIVRAAGQGIVEYGLDPRADQRPDRVVAVRVRGRDRPRSSARRSTGPPAADGRAAPVLVRRRTNRTIVSVSPPLPPSYIGPALIWG